jgi:hypothetical protein
MCGISRYIITKSSELRVRNEEQEKVRRELISRKVTRL